MKNFIEPRSFGTHDGSFHADEVTACSLLLLFGLIDRDKIRRTRDPSVLERCDFVCDVGGVYDSTLRRFDHHQVGFQGSLSSAGMVLLYLKEQKWIEPALYDMFNRSLILGVDAHDNGVAKLEMGVASFSQVVSNFLPIAYDATELPTQHTRCRTNGTDHQRHALPPLHTAIHITNNKPTQDCIHITIINTALS